MSEVNYELKGKLEYAFKGELKQAMFVTLSAPAFKQVDKVAPLKQALTAAIRDLPTPNPEHKAASASDEKITGPEIIQILYQGTGEMARVLAHARQLFISGVALIDGETRFTLPLIDDMSMDDVEGMLGEYLAAFIVPSLMGGR